MDSSGSLSTYMQSLVDYMSNDGWCIHQANYLAQSFDEQTMYYFATFPRSSRRPENHEKCRSQPNCVAYNVDMDDYETRHQFSCDRDSCEDVAVPYDRLVNIIRDGFVPLVTLHRSRLNASQLSIKVSKRRKNSHYTAISHVWADGLGNPKSNSLPSCQLKCLMATETYFWMDTLCIPVKPEDSQLRSISINTMASIYAGAHTTLVLDSELLRTPSDTPDCLARIICSVWMRRSWTLQEALLSPRCKIQFRDNRAITFNPFARVFHPFMTWDDSGEPVELVAHEKSISTNGFNQGVWVCLENYLRDQFFHARDILRLKDTIYGDKFLQQQNDIFSASNRIIGFLSSILGPTIIRPPLPAQLVDTDKFTNSPKFLSDWLFARTFVLIWNALAGRSTTMTNDLFFILANMLDMQCEPLMNLSLEDRIQAIIFSSPSVPLSLLWWQGPKQNSTAHPLNNWIPAQLNQNRLDYHGSNLNFLPNEGEGDFMEVYGNAALRRILVKHNRILASLRKFNLTVNRNAFTFYIEASANLPASFCILFESDEDTPPTHAVLLRVLSQESNTLRLAYHCPVTIKTISIPTDDIQEILNGTLLSPDHKVLVEYNRPALPQLQHPEIELVPLKQSLLLTIAICIFSWVVGWYLYSINISTQAWSWWQVEFLQLFSHSLIEEPVQGFAILLMCFYLRAQNKERQWKYAESFLPSRAAKKSLSRIR